MPCRMKGWQGEKEGLSSHRLGFCFPFLPQAWDKKKNVRMCRRMRRCEAGERERAWPIESRVFSGSKVSLQSLLMQSPWEPINLSAAALSIRPRHTWKHTSIFFWPTHNTAFTLTKWSLLSAQHSVSPYALAHTDSLKTSRLMLFREEEVVDNHCPNTFYKHI